MPQQNRDFWEAKISGNRNRDQRTLKAQFDAGWRVAVVWECSLKGRGRLGADAVVDILSRWLSTSDELLEVRGN
jgi:DNA mismatch endonuclease (patch repair protein)